ncbi:MAG: STAS domain-containing protein [Myxococcaceae bacterium]|nr:STAS domain-containing protein [Myxococcaceae bacterium]
MIDVHREMEGVMTLRISGKFNFSCYKEFQDAVSGPVPTRYVIDLSRADYIDSSALGMLLLLREKVGEDASRVVIRSGSGQPSEVLRLANFQRLFTVN